MEILEFLTILIYRIIDRCFISPFHYLNISNTLLTLLSGKFYVYLRNIIMLRMNIMVISVMSVSVLRCIVAWHCTAVFVTYQTHFPLGSATLRARGAIHVSWGGLWPLKRSWGGLWPPKSCIFLTENVSEKSAVGHGGCDLCVCMQIVTRAEVVSYGLCPFYQIIENISFMKKSLLEIMGNRRPSEVHN